MDKYDKRSLIIAYLSIPISLLIINAEEPAGLFVYNNYIVLLGNILYFGIMVIGITSLIVIYTITFNKSEQ